MANLFEMKQERQEVLDKADVLIRAAENANRALTTDESRMLDGHMEHINRLNNQIETKEKLNTLVPQLKNGMLIPGGPGGGALEKPQPKTFSLEYFHGFHEWLKSGGLNTMSAALIEGTGSQGGFAVPSMVDGQIVPLAPQEMGVRKLATVLPTAMDIRIPQQASFSTTSLKLEAASFTESEPTLSQITLSAFMAGNLHNISWELAQDVPSFQAFAIDDLLLAQQMLEESLYVSGTGVGQAQGLIGNTGTGTGVPIEPDAKGNLVTIDSTFDVMGTLNAMYHPGAAWLMQRATGIILRKAQAQANLFEPVFNRVGAQDYLHGYPVEYSTSMPSAIRGHIPVLFGDFKRGYVIGDRGGSGINIKILDQPLASQGILQILAYRRTDGRVRRSEAIQQIQIALS